MPTDLGQFLGYVQGILQQLGVWNMITWYISALLLLTGAGFFFRIFRQ